MEDLNNNFIIKFYNKMKPVKIKKEKKMIEVLKPNSDIKIVFEPIEDYIFENMYPTLNDCLDKPSKISHK